MTCGIYTITGPNGRVYVGQSRNISERWRMFRYELRRGRYRSPHLQRAWNKYGEAAFVFAVVETCAPDALTTREQAWMDTLRSRGLYNCAPAAGSTRGHKWTPEQRAAFSGRSLSDETKAKMSAVRKGRSPTPEARLRMSLAATRRWASRADNRQ